MTDLSPADSPADIALRAGDSIAPPAASATASEEWQLAEFVDAVAAEVDRAEDTLALKARARGVTFALKQLNLELEVKVRRDPVGRIWFRTTNPDEASATVLKLDLTQMLPGQMQGGRRVQDLDGSARELTTLPGITAQEIARLNAIAIYSVDDLERYTQSGAMIAEVSRKSGIEDARLRRWLALPFIAELKPPAGEPGSQVLIEGGNFGPALDPNASILYRGAPVTIVSWSDARILVKMPADARESGVLFAVIGGRITNAVSWQVAAVDLVVRDLRMSPGEAFAGEPVTFQAVVANQGSASTEGGFDVQWLIDDKPMGALPHGPLQPGQTSNESSTRVELKLAAGTHQVRFIVDPGSTLPDLNRANGSFVRSFVVQARRELRFGDDALGDDVLLDPLRTKDARVYSLLRLVFRGLLGYQHSGAHEPNLAETWAYDAKRDDGNTLWKFKLDPRVETFHDGQPFTAGDVVYTYKLLAKSPLWGASVEKHVLDVFGDKYSVSILVRGQRTTRDLLDLFTVGIVSKAAYEADRDGFGRQPIGCGPFAVASAKPSGIVLDRFEQYYLGRPRIDRIRIDAGPGETLAKQLAGGELHAMRAAYSEAIYAQLREVEGIDLFPAKPVAAPGSADWLAAQTQRLRERTLNGFDFSANAHAWYLAGEERIVAKPRSRGKRRGA